jgi:ribosomal protein S18 acetylase RimI-like enzyme
MNASTLNNAPAATALTVADPAHIDLLEAMTGRFHQGEGVQLPAAHRKSALANLLASPGQGCILLVEHCATGQVCGYAILAYGFSLEFGGRDAFLDEFYIDEQFRGRGIGKAALEAICQWAREAGLAAVHLEVEKANTSAKALYANLGFEDREHYHLMSLRIAVPKDR